MNKAETEVLAKSAVPVLHCVICKGSMTPPYLGVERSMLGQPWHERLDGNGHAAALAITRGESEREALRCLSIPRRDAAGVARALREHLPPNAHVA